MELFSIIKGQVSIDSTQSIHSFKCALITGVTGGLGYELAYSLAMRSKKMILTGRVQSTLQQLAHELKTKYNYNGEVELLPLDLSVSHDFSKIVEFQQEIDLVINNAAIGYFRAFTDMTESEVSSMVMVNMYSLTLMNKFFADKMAKMGRGQIINVASMAAYFPVPYYSVYAATKSYVLSLSVSLDQELRHRGVRVKALCPGGIKTEFSHRAGLNSTALKKQYDSFSEAKDIAAETMRLIDHDKGVLIPGQKNRLSALFMRLLPLAISSYLAKKSQEQFLTSKS